MAIAYANGGNTYLGEPRNRPLKGWRKMGAELKQRYMYKGYRYWGGKKDVVVVFDTGPWSSAEIKRRRANGFLGIKEYRL